MTEDLTSTDRALIRILQENGRTPYTEIARELGISAKTVGKRIGDLVARDVIEIVTITDPRLLGFDAIALVGVRLDHSRSPSEVVDDLIAIEAVDYVIVTTGRFNLLVELVATDRQALARIIERDVLTIGGIAASEVFPYLRLEYQEPRFLAARRGRGVGLPADRSIDEVDRAILAQLSVDGRMPFPRIAHALAVSEAQVRQRVGRMIESGATRILALADPAVLGFRTSAWLSCTSLPGTSVRDLARRIAELPSITYVAVTGGRFDVFAEAVCVDEDDLLTVLDEQLRPLEGVARAEVAVYLSLRHKVVAAPRVQGRGAPAGGSARVSDQAAIPEGEVEVQ